MPPKSRSPGGRGVRLRLNPGADAWANAEPPLVGRFGEMPTVADVRLSPDGRTVAYTVVEVDVNADSRSTGIWLAPVDGSSEPEALKTGGPTSLQPRWSPDGASLAFVSDDGEGGMRICVASVAGDRASVLATWADEPIEALEWSPNGRMLAFSARSRDPHSYRNGQPFAFAINRVRSTLDGAGFISCRRRHLFVVDSDRSNAPRQLTFGDFDDDGLAWSPDSRRIAFVSDRGVDRDLKYSTDIFTVESSGGNPIQITDSNSLYGSPTWSSDGGRIACIMTPDPAHAHRHSHVAVINSDGSKETVLTRALDRNCSGVGSGPHGGGGRAFCWRENSLLFLVHDAGAAHLYQVEARSGSIPEQLVAGERQVRAFDSVAGILAAVTTDATHPAGLTLFVNGSERRVTDFGRSLPVQRPIRFAAPSGKSGEVEGWVLPPAGLQSGRRYPTILHVHGGPNYMDGYRYSPEKQTLAAAGYAVIYSNPRGSTGYTESWARAVRGAKASIDPGGGFGEPAFADLMAVLDEAGRRFDFVDLDRVAITGTSYGGFMTVWSLGSTDRFKAGVAINSSTNLVSLLWRGDWIVPWLSGQLGVDVLEDTEEVWRNSPMSRVRGIQAPLLLLHAEEDKACTIEQSEQVFTTLRFLGRPTEMVRFPRASHVVATPLQLRERLRRTLEWFQRHLPNPASPGV